MQLSCKKGEGGRENLHREWLQKYGNKIFFWALSYKQSTFYNFSFDNFWIVKISIMEKIREVFKISLKNEKKIKTKPENNPLEKNSIFESYM